MYNKAIRLTALVNENKAAYRISYDVSDRLMEEQRIDNLTRRFAYNHGGQLNRKLIDATLAGSEVLQTAGD